jgi:CheY-like chemotaxis protein
LILTISLQNGRQAISSLDKITPDLIITDWMMAPVDGLEYTNFIRTDSNSPDPFAPIILMTGHTGYTPRHNSPGHRRE